MTLTRPRQCGVCLRKYSYVLEFQASAGGDDKKLFSVLNNAVFLEMLIFIFVFMNPKSDSKYAQRSHCLLYTSPSPRDRQKARMPSSA